MQQSKTKKPSKQKLGNRSNGSIRIIGGQMRGRKLHFTTVDGLRPTLDRIRETLFNWLIKEISGAHCLDLFAGSGALGFEALSRGAESLVMVEKNSKVSQTLINNCELLKLSNVKVYNQNYKNFLKKNTQKFNLVFLDPPFRKDMLNDIIETLPSHLATDALIYIEQENSNEIFEPNDTWHQIKYKNTGSLSYALYRFAKKTA